ncbi:endospore germination permease [Cohnella sp. REN36]|uniref:GerAB/ArcD/ProY family transporter n=1 Tax=Cohnella sp. REN36 TaxID=2887347 RepID=UPI001D13A513|nr:endospore germination permease [Cohnella sp. REN36]MCC3376852.1 endospore germination permease [Cohnella sp. REN36]
MGNDGKISARQFLVLLFLYTIGTTILVIPSGLATVARQDAWIGALAGVLIGLGVAALYRTLWGKYPNLSFAGICERVLGKVVGKAVTLAFVFYAFIGSTTVLYYVGNFFTTQIMPETPIQFINGLFAVIVVMGVRMGAEALARSAEIILPWFIGLFFVLILSLSPDLKIEQFQPVMEARPNEIIGAALSFAGTASLPLVFLFMLFPRVQMADQARKGMLIVHVAGGLCVFLVTLFSIGVLGADVTSRNMFPSYELAKKINIGNFFQRIEVIMAGLWFVSTYYKTSLYFYGFATGVAEMLNLKDYKSLTWPMGILMVLYSLVVYPNVVYMQHWDATVYIPYILVMGAVVPLLLLTAGIIRSGLPDGRE